MELGSLRIEVVPHYPSPGSCKRTTAGRAEASRSILSSRLSSRLSRAYILFVHASHSLHAIGPQSAPRQFCETVE